MLGAWAGTGELTPVPPGEVLVVVSPPPEGEYGADAYAGVWTGLPVSPLLTFLNDHFGSNLHRGGDLDGDGLEEIIAGASGADDERGAAYVLQGPATGEHAANEGYMEIGAGTVGFWTSDSLGEAHDLDLDGYLDMAVGAEGGGNAENIDDIPGGDPGGVVCMWYGPISGGVTTLDYADACILKGTEYNARLGASWVAPGDITGDGWPDLALGATHAEGVTGLFNAGEVWVVTPSEY